MPTKMIAVILSFFSFFAFWNPNGQPNIIPETRSYVGEIQDGLVADKYGVWPTEDFETGSASFLFGPGLELLYAVKGFFTSGHVNDGFLVLHKGKIVYENYPEGWDKDTPHHMYSVTKSVTSALVGIAIADGYIEGVDQKVADFYDDVIIAPGQKSKLDMTIEHLLTMTSGIDYQFDWDAMWQSDDPGAILFALPQPQAPGTRYHYSMDADLLAFLLSKAIGRNLHDYAQEKLFGPLGMTSVEWVETDAGVTMGGWGISMTPRDMARFGYLYLNHGRWEDTQIIPADYVAISPPRSKAPRAYGYLFWNTPQSPFSSAYEADGAFGQFITIMPEWDTVIVRTGSEGWANRVVSCIGDMLGL